MNPKLVALAILPITASVVIGFAGWIMRREQRLARDSQKEARRQAAGEVGSGAMSDGAAPPVTGFGKSRRRRLKRRRTLKL